MDLVNVGFNIFLNVYIGIEIMKKFGMFFVFCVLGFFMIVFIVGCGGDIEDSGSDLSGLDLGDSGDDVGDDVGDEGDEGDDVDGLDSE